MPFCVTSFVIMTEFYIINTKVIKNVIIIIQLMNNAVRESSSNI